MNQVVARQDDPNTTAVPSNPPAVPPASMLALSFVRAWRDAGHPIDQHPTAPPCDALEDEVYDVMLGHVFRDIARLDTLTERVCRLQEAIDVNLPMIEFCRARREEAAADRIERMVNVLRKWGDEIVAAPATEARAA